MPADDRVGRDDQVPLNNRVDRRRDGQSVVGDGFSDHGQPIRVVVNSKRRTAGTGDQRLPLDNISEFPDLQHRNSNLDCRMVTTAEIHCPGSGTIHHNDISSATEPFEISQSSAGQITGGMGNGGYGRQ